MTSILPRTMHIMIKIEKVGELYTAKVKPESPRSLDPTWNSPQPMTAKELFDSLEKIGCHPVDIWDAFHDVDPNLHRM
jgi:hypothetical protein